MSTPDRPMREDLPGGSSGAESLGQGSSGSGWLPPAGDQPDTDPTGRPWERTAPETAPAVSSAPSAWPGSEQQATPQAPAYAGWPGSEQHPAAQGHAGSQGLAGFGARAGAAIIDALVVLALFAIPTALGAILFAVGRDPGYVGVGIGFVIGFILALAYAPYMLAKRNGQTVGKKVTDIRVVMTDGSQLTGGRAFVREFLVKGLLMGTIGQFTFYVLTLLNYLWPLWDKDNEALHDKLCATRVVEA